MLSRYTDSSRCRKQACTHQVIFDPLPVIWSRNGRLHNSVAHGWISEATQELQESVVQDHWGSQRKRVKKGDTVCKEFVKTRGKGANVCKKCVEKRSTWLAPRSFPNDLSCVKTSLFISLCILRDLPQRQKCLGSYAVPDVPLFLYGKIFWWDRSGKFKKIGRKEWMKEKEEAFLHMWRFPYLCVLHLSGMPQSTALVWLSLGRTHSYGNFPYNLSLKHQPVIVPSKVMEGTNFDLSF